MPGLDVPGAGAAGGLGAGLIAFAGGVLQPGVNLVAGACRLKSRLAGADLVITGEGRIDGQTPHGKTPAGVARVARQLGVPVVAIAGSRDPAMTPCTTAGWRGDPSSGTMSLGRRWRAHPNSWPRRPNASRAPGRTRAGASDKCNAAGGCSKAPQRRKLRRIGWRATSFRGGPCVCAGSGCISSTPGGLSCYARS